MSELGARCQSDVPIRRAAGLRSAQVHYQRMPSGMIDLGAGGLPKVFAKRPEYSGGRQGMAAVLDESNGFGQQNASPPAIPRNVIQASGTPPSAPDGGTPTMKKTRFLAAAAFIALSAFSPPAHAAYDKATTTTVTNVVVLHDGSFYLHVADNACTNANNRRVVYSYNGKSVDGKMPTEAGRDRMLKAATAAYLSGSAVRVYVDEPQSGEWGCLLGAINLM